MFNKLTDYAGTGGIDNYGPLATCGALFLVILFVTWLISDDDPCPVYHDKDGNPDESTWGV